MLPPGRAYKQTHAEYDLRVEAGSMATPTAGIFGKTSLGAPSGAFRDAMIALAAEA